MKVVWVSFCLMLIGATAIFYIFQGSFSDMLFNLALQPKIQEVLTQSMEDQRHLSEVEPDKRTEYRARFEEIKILRNNYYIVEHSRSELARNFQVALMSLLLAILLSSGGFYFWQHRQQQKRLQGLQSHLVALSEGQTDIQVADQGRDMLGHIARMIEKTSGVMARQRRRLSNMDALSAWQEAARRHAHEIRTPLTAARMEVNAMASFVCKRAPELSERTRFLQESVNEELDQLKDFTAAFTSFAKIGKPKPSLTVVHGMLEKFTTLFNDAWANLDLELSPGHEEVAVSIDKDMVRQVLVNLCNNSSLAVVKPRGKIRFSLQDGPDALALDVSDDGPGIPEGIRASVFKPYTTSRKIGEGMGLGLSIAQKIMLDHGGDLVLIGSSEEGTRFRLLFPKTLEGLDSWQ